MMINFEGSDVRIDAIEEIKALKLPIFLWGGGGIFWICCRVFESESYFR